jgi:hypothetical protein
MIFKNEQEQEKAIDILTKELQTQITKLNSHAKNKEYYLIYKTCENIYILTDLLIEMAEDGIKINLSFMDRFFDIIEQYNINNNNYVKKIAQLFM